MDELGPHRETTFRVSCEDSNVPLWPQCPICAWEEQLSGGLSRLGRTPGALPSLQSLAQAWGEEPARSADTSVQRKHKSRKLQLSGAEAARPDRAWGCPSQPPPCTHWTLPSLKASGWCMPVPGGFANSSSQTPFPPGSTCTQPAPAFLGLLALTFLHPSISSPPWNGNGHAGVSPSPRG